MAIISLLTYPESKKPFIAAQGCRVFCFKSDPGERCEALTAGSERRNHSSAGGRSFWTLGLDAVFD